MTALPLSPKDVNYLSSRLIFEQLTENEVELSLDADNAEALETPKLKLDGAGRAYLTGSLTLINATPTAGMALFSLPEKIRIDKDYFMPVMKKSGSTLSAVGITLLNSSSSIESVTVTAPGSYATMPTVSTTGEGSGANFENHMKVVSATLASNPTSGSSYAPGDTIFLADGTYSSQGVLLVATTGVYEATVLSGGTGGTPGTQTVTGTTGIGTKFTASVTVSGGGAITAVLSITSAGNYTVNPSFLGTEPVTGAGLSGAVLNIHMKPVSFTVQVAGNYTDIPSSPVLQESTSGSGAGGTYTVLWGLRSIEVTDGGKGYDNSSAIVISGGGGSGGGAATLNLNEASPNVEGTLSIAATQNDVLYLDGTVFFVESY